MNEAVPLGKELAVRRRSLGLTQEKLAALVGVTAVELCRWETSRFRPSLTNYLRLQKALLLAERDHRKDNRLATLEIAKAARARIFEKTGKIFDTTASIKES